MKDKNLPDDINSKSLSELTELVENLLQKLEGEKNLENSILDYQKIIMLNNLIQKKFSKTSKEISEETNSKIKKIKIK
ncbi:MAG: exonuclease VII small subunit [Candidatus Pelagibacter sp. TMED118]|nr:MAG: exonuclease VII small subunit [Candidatus Pelagibacter sp. TMED118]RPG99857.1 MAG: exonuclease VII small subunit [Candidatus Pelagibacter sp. TMED118]|tara:strand:- start:2480 stop:2713 length:234 start_codon:yes stop_codon:yes gene_type:complete